MNESEFMKNNCNENFKNSNDNLKMYERLREEI